MSEKAKESKKPQEKPQPGRIDPGRFYFSSSIKIYDPNTKEILVQKRGDN